MTGLGVRSWALPESALRDLVAAYGAAVEAAKAGRITPPQGVFRERVDGAVLILPVRGVLLRRRNLASLVLGLMTYRELEGAVRRAAQDPEIGAIVLDVDSPGGDALGLAAVSGALREARDAKPVVAFVSGLGTSAAYLISSAAGRVVAAPDAVLGSIGAVLTISETPNTDTIEIVSSQTPRKHPDPRTAEGHQQLQQEVDAIAQVFIETVAANRGVPVADVLRNFGQGAVFVGEGAVQAGLADATGSLNAIVAGLLGGETNPPPDPLPIVSGRPAIESVEWDDVQEAARACYRAASQGGTSWLTRTRDAVAAEGFVHRLRDQEGVSATDALALAQGDQGTAARLGLRTLAEDLAAEAQRSQARIAAYEADEQDLPQILPIDSAPDPGRESRRRVGGVVEMARRMGLVSDEGDR